MKSKLEKKPKSGRISRFEKTLRPDLKVRPVGKNGSQLEISSGKGKDRLSYTVNRREANAERAALINSKMPVLVVRPPM